MSKRLILCHVTILALLLTNLPVTQAQTIIAPDRGGLRRPRPMLISSYEDDPFVRESDVRRMDPERFGLGEDGRPTLSGSLVSVGNESKLYRKDPKDGVYKPFAWNPWPWVPTSNSHGDFRFPDEERFPLHRVERGSDGKIILKDGLQVWTPNDRRLGSTTTFEAAHVVKDAAEAWAGRDILWGRNGVLEIEPHAFIEFNAFYSANTRTLHFGVAPYRLPGQTDIKIFETATSWEMVAHESGHAVQDTLKPNRDRTHQGFGAWAESFADQTGMWASLRNRERVLRLLAETGGDLNQSNAITRLGEAFAALTGKGTGQRDAFNDLKVSDTTEQIHDRSKVLTGAAYRIFLTIYDELKCELSEEEALGQAGRIMGFFLMRATDYTPENQVTLEDVAKACLKVDKEFFGWRYHTLLAEEFTRREIFDADSVREWLAHEAARPRLYLPHWWSDEMVERMVQANLDKLGIGPEFGLKAQSVTRLNLPGGQSRGRVLPSRGPAQTIVRVQLMQGRGPDATPLDNHGILVFRASGLLADYHAPLPPQDHVSLAPDGFAQAQAVTTLYQAGRLGLDQHGAPLSIVRRPGGQMTVEARVMRGAGLNAYLEVFTLDNPRGARREILIPPVPPDKHLHIAEDLLR
jgi:hypothetical protein